VQTGAHRRRLRIVSIALLLILTGIFSTVCTHKRIRVPVSEEDVLRANEASQEGDIAFNRKDYYAALIKYLEAARWNPNNENTFNRLGITYSLLNFYDEARQALERALELRPKFAYAVNNLGSVYFAQRNYKKAEKCFKKAINWRANEASFHMNLGSLYFEKKKPDKAMAEWRKGLALDPDIFSKSSAISLAGATSTSQMEKSYFMARLFASAGNVESAIENLKLAITQGFSDVDAIEKQPDFDRIRQDPRFVEFMQSVPLLIKLHSKVGLPSSASDSAPAR
jgi:tetratricopeptide (TPR) repeat protein